MQEISRRQWLGTTTTPGAATIFTGILAPGITSMIEVR
jgi:hypothetical protein